MELQDYRIDRSRLQLSPGPEIGRGGFGIVRLGILDPDSPSSSTRVAVKQLQSSDRIIPLRVAYVRECSAPSPTSAT